MKEAQGLESELGSLARRKSDLEDAELEIMERLEAADAAVAEQEAADRRDERRGLDAERGGQARRRRRHRGVRGRDPRPGRGGRQHRRPTCVAYYDRVAARSAGAALLRRGTCEGCRMVLAGTDLQTVRLAAEDAVVTCPECGCILVRTEESGL